MCIFDIVKFIEIPNKPSCNVDREKILRITYVVSLKGRLNWYGLCIVISMQAYWSLMRQGQYFCSGWRLHQNLIFVCEYPKKNVIKWHQNYDVLLYLAVTGIWEFQSFPKDHLPNRKSRHLHMNIRYISRLSTQSTANNLFIIIIS